MARDQAVASFRWTHEHPPRPQAYEERLVPSLEENQEALSGSWNGGRKHLHRKHLQVEQQVPGRQISKGGRRRSQSKELLVWTRGEEADPGLESQPLSCTGEATWGLTVRQGRRKGLPLTGPLTSLPGKHHLAWKQFRISEWWNLKPTRWDLRVLPVAPYEAYMNTAKAEGRQPRTVKP